MDFGIAGKQAIVTGGAKGIGAAIARALAAEGASVWITDIDAAAATATADAIVATGARAEACTLDVADRAAVTRSFAAIAESAGQIDILVNNAGIVRRAPTATISTEEWDLVEGVNFRGALYCCQAAMEGMRHRRWGRIVNILSLATKMIGSVDVASYATSKAALGGLTRVLAKDLAPHGVTVNAVLPGSIAETDFSDAMGQPRGIAPPEGLAIPVGRRGTPEDVAPVVAFLCSVQAAYVTGEFVDINGGVLMD